MTFARKLGDPRQTADRPKASAHGLPAPGPPLRFLPGSLGRFGLVALQRAAGNRAVAQLFREAHPAAGPQRQPNRTGLPDGLKAGIERLSGVRIDDVRAHTNSSKPAAVDARAYTRGPDIEVAPGQVRHLPHEAWHLVQQRQGRVKPTGRVAGGPVNDDPALEREADVMGTQAKKLGAGSGAGGRARAPAGHPAAAAEHAPAHGSPVMQLQKGLTKGATVMVRVVNEEGADDYPAVIVAVLENGAKYQVKFDEDMLNQYLSNTYAEGDVRSRRVITPVPTTTTTTTAGAPWDKDYLQLPGNSKDEVKKVVGEAEKITDLSEDQVESLINLLRAVTGPNNLLKDLIRALEFDLKDLRENNERPEEAALREEHINAEIASLEDEAFSARFRVKPTDAAWADIEEEVIDWWLEMKDAEVGIEFEAAFRANRMTARQVNAKGRRGQFQAQKYGSGPNPATDRWMVLNNTLEGIEKRKDPRNFKSQEAVNTEGLHDLSASLLRGDSGTGIYEQLKKYEDAIVVFMPLPKESDLQIFSALTKVRGMDPSAMAAMSRLLTRPIFAQASDMGTRYTDTSPGSASTGKFEYGLTGTVIRKPRDRARAINAADRAARRKGALSYEAVATSAITRVNEIVMAYRHHASGIFPMYGRWNKEKSHFDVVTANQTPTGHIITNDGQYK